MDWKIMGREYEGEKKEGRVLHSLREVLEMRGGVCSNIWDFHWSPYHMMYTMTVRMASTQGSRPKTAVQRAGSVVNGQIGRYTLNPSTRDKWKSCRQRRMFWPTLSSHIFLSPSLSCFIPMKESLYLLHTGRQTQPLEQKTRILWGHLVLRCWRWAPEQSLQPPECLRMEKGGDSTEEGGKKTKEGGRGTGERKQKLEMDWKIMGREYEGEKKEGRVLHSLREVLEMRGGVCSNIWDFHWSPYHMMYTMTVRMASTQGSRPKTAVQRAGSVVNGQIGRYTLNPSIRDMWKSCK